eukprot:scaffold170830_cov29-Tisochrysis_lutea.AAC.4
MSTPFGHRGVGSAELFFAYCSSATRIADAGAQKRPSLGRKLLVLSSSTALSHVSADRPAPCTSCTTRCRLGSSPSCSAIFAERVHMCSHVLSLCEQLSRSACWRSPRRYISRRSA